MAVEYDEIGIWSEVKLAIIKEYSSAYAAILDARKRKSIPGLKWLYIDAFAGSGFHLSKTSGEVVDGSPLIALKTTPPFSEYSRKPVAANIVDDIFNKYRKRQGL